MVSDLSGRTALVTGGARRIGRATSLALANAGANVIVHYNRSAAEAEELVEQIRDLGVQAWSVKAELGLPEELESLIDRAHGLAGSLDILVNNASVFSESAFETFILDDLHENININAWAPFVLAKRFVDLGTSGHIVNFLDTRVAGYDWSHVAYHASKSLLALFTRMMALKFAPAFAVNAVAPGLILPPEGKDESYLEGLKDHLPLKRIGSPKDVTDAVLFLARSKFITGQVIFVDGGRHLREAIIG